MQSTTSANVPVEFAFTADGAYGDPFDEVFLDVLFTDPAGKEMKVPAFWEGGRIWKVRYASPVVGSHRFRSECSHKDDKGLHAVEGRVRITPYSGNNPLYTHGPLRVAANHRYLEHVDGTPFFWLGDTWWMGLCHRLHWPEDFKKLAADRKAKGFNVVQIVAGLYPDMFPFDPRGANERGYPWETNYARIRPEYFDAADERLKYLVEEGFTPCIVGAWGYFMPWMGVEKMKAHWRYLIARYGAWPVVWCAAGEANLPWYQAKGFPYDDRKQVQDWTEVMRYIRATDPFHRVLTVHPTGIGRLSARHATDDVALLDFDMLQTPHGQREAVPATVATVRESYADKPVMPVINGEAAYEMLNDSLGTEWTRRMFWLCMMNGAAGHTYGANGIWQVNRKGQPHGPSPTSKEGVGYGRIAWDEAMNLAGSRQVGLGKKLLEQFAWQKFEPHPEWAEFADKSSVRLEGADWIWFPEGDPAKDAPAEKRFFRRSFILPKEKTVQGAQLRISADDRFIAWMNGQSVGSGEAWGAARKFNNLASKLHPGTNVLAIEARNMPASGNNPAGLIAVLEVKLSSGEIVNVVSDPSWLAARAESARWNTSGFDDRAWGKAMTVARYGGGPWGKIDQPQNDGFFGPQSSGIAGQVRLIYVPESQAIVVRGLEPRIAYSSYVFDAVTGNKSASLPIRADSNGIWTCPPPKDSNQDWVLVITR